MQAATADSGADTKAVAGVMPSTVKPVVDEIAIFLEHAARHLDTKDIAAVRDVFAKHDIRRVDPEISGLNKSTLLMLGLGYGATVRFLEHHYVIVMSAGRDIAWAKLSEEEKRRIEDDRKADEQRRDEFAKQQAEKIADAKRTEAEKIANAEKEAELERVWKREQEEQRKKEFDAKVADLKARIQQRKLELEREREANTEAGANATSAR